MSIKQVAKKLVHNSKPRIFTAGFFYLLLCVVIAELSGRLLGINMSLAELEQYYEHVYNGNVEYALSLASQMSPGIGAQAINLALQLVQHIVFAGFLIFILNSIRGTAASFGNLLDGFAYVGKLIGILVLRGIFVALWSLLFVVPGIIAAYRYRMAVYILLDNPEMSAMQCLRESKRMMQGHKAELFKLDLSFIGWYLLSMIPLVEYFVMLWYVPYLNTTISLFYEDLRLRSYESF